MTFPSTSTTKTTSKSFAYNQTIFPETPGDNKPALFLVLPPKAVSFLFWPLLQRRRPGAEGQAPSLGGAIHGAALRVFDRVSAPGPMKKHMELFENWEVNNFVLLSHP